MSTIKTFHFFAQKAVSEGDYVLEAKNLLNNAQIRLEQSTDEYEARQAVKDCRTAEFLLKHHELMATLERRIAIAKALLADQNTDPSMIDKLECEVKNCEEYLTDFQSYWNWRDAKKSAARKFDLPHIKNDDGLVENPPDLELMEDQWINELYVPYGPPYQVPIGPNGQLDMRFYMGDPAKQTETEKQAKYADRTSEGIRMIRKIHRTEEALIERTATKLILQTLSNAPGAHFIAAAPTGSGKTSVAFELGRIYYTIYFPCTSNNQAPNDHAPNVDTSAFGILYDEIKKCSEHFPGNNEQEKQEDEARRVSAAMLVSHLFLLNHFLTVHATGTPYQFLMYQLDPNQGPLIVLEVFEQLSRLSMSALWLFAATASNEIRARLLPSRDRLFLVIDEMENATGEDKKMFPSRGISEFGDRPYGRSPLLPLLQSAGDLSEPCGWNLLIMGQNSVEARYKSIAVDIGKTPLYFLHSGHFPPATENDVHRLLALRGLNETNIAHVPEVSKYLYNARFGLVAKTIENLRALAKASVTTATNELKSAVTKSVGVYQELFSDRLRARAIGSDADIEDFHEAAQSLYVSALNPGEAFLLEQYDRLGLHFRLDRSKRHTKKYDWCLMGLAHVDERGVFHVVEESAMEVFKNYFDEHEGLLDTVPFDLALASFSKMIDGFGTKTSVKGNSFEVVTYCAIKKCNGMVVSELPYVGLNADNPACEFWSKVKIVVSGDLVRNSGSASDAHVLLGKCAKVKSGLAPINAHRADIVLLLCDLNATEHVAILQASTKLYSNDVPSNVALEQYNSTDPTKPYYGTDGIEPNEDYDPHRAVWGEYNLDKLPALRIHINIPGFQVPQKDKENRERLKHGMKVLPDGSLVVNIDLNNIDSFFGVFDKERRIALYELLFDITGRKELKRLIGQLKM